MSTTHEGGCLCGAVRYRLDGDPIASTTCQCRTCCKAAASALVPWLHVDATKFVITAGKPVEFQSSAAVTRTFCGRCGTPLTYWTESYGPRIDVTTVSLDDRDAYPPMGHFWTSHKLGWLQLADGLPALEEGLPSE